LPQLELTLWSLVVALLLIGLWAPLLERLDRSASFIDVFRLPTAASGELVVLLYASAPVLGTLAGWADESGWTASVLGVFGFDLRRSDDVWREVFRSPPPMCYVYMEDGTALYGFPQSQSRDRQDAATELYLTKVKLLQNGNWTDLPSNREGVLLDALKISRIEIRKAEGEAPDGSER
jgi:hypothetical protein